VVVALAAILADRFCSRSKTLGYENISSKADTMEDEESSISFLKVFLIPLATYTLQIR
jgi:hypothetical protein